MSFLRITLIVWGLLLDASEADECDADWFGSDCRYKCRCTDNKCDDYGICKDGSKCSTGWFGPACQYADLAAHRQIKQSASSITYGQLTDGDEKSCVDVSSFKSLTVDLTTPYPFTWMRINLDRPDQTNGFSIQFKNKSHTDIISNCSNQNTFVVNPTTIDIHCDVDMAVDQVIVSWKNVQSICSVYISGGRNVALKQNTTQSTTAGLIYNSSAAVNDELTWSSGNPSCTHTQNESSPHWNLYFTQPEVVNRYVLYNRNQYCCSKRLQGFILESFSSDGSQVLNHTDTRGIQVVYRVLSVGKKKPVSQVKITATFRDYRKNNPDYFTFLTLCEVQVYGDSQCPKGQYGLECNKTCNCAKDEDCFVSTGGCPSGCAAGFYRDECREECPASYHGVDCLKSCSNTCKNQSCDRVSGKCHGCVPGKQGDFCTKDCSERTYGQNCKESCSVFCDGDGSCDSYNGTCPQGCKTGYQGAKCNETCLDGFYGEGCSSNCSYCQGINSTDSNNKCHHVNGACIYGCQPGYEKMCPSGLSMNTGDDDDDDSSTVAIVVGNIAALLVITLVIIAILLWRRHKKSPSKISKHMKDEPKTAQSQIQMSETLSHEYEEIPDDFVDTQSVDEESKHSVSTEDEESAAQAKKNKVYYNMAPGKQNTAISIEDLGTFLRTHDMNFFEHQFHKIPTNNDVAMTVGQRPENKSKNRYKNICAFDHSRVHLKSDPKKSHGDYINASFVEGYNNKEKFIASQGTTKSMINDFVRMLWEQKVEKVVMLTNLIENGKMKCERYWPEDDNLQFDEIQVKLTTTDVLADYTIRRLQLSKDGEVSREVTQYHFTSWPDKDVPNTPWGLVDFEQRVALEPTDKPIVVHCSAGVGRTGTFIALRNVMREAEETGKMDFYSTLFKLRQDRVMMIQTLDQYIFLHKAAQVAQLCIGTTLTEDMTEERIKTLEMKSLKGETNMEAEFQAICKVCENMEDDHITSGEEKEDENLYQNNDIVNNDKNRFPDVIPKPIYRAPLASEDNSNNNYINAVLVPSFTKQNQNILTQLPMPGTINDFWRLVTQYKVSLIVAFEDDLIDTDSTIGSYLPRSKEEPISCQNFEIESKFSKSRNFWTEMKLSVLKKNLDVSVGEIFDLTHFSCASADIDSRKALTLVKQIRSHRSAGQGRILYMCRNGATFSGLVCVVSLLLDRMEHDRRLTVPLVVGGIKAIRPQVIPSLDQYSLLYQVLHRYVETTNSYTNFGVLSSDQNQTPGVNPVMKEPEEEQINVYANNAFEN